MTIDELKLQIRGFIQKNFLFEASFTLTDAQSLVGSGVVDSTGILELIGHLEETYQLKFSDAELVADNFDSLDRISSFVHTKIVSRGH